MSDVTRILSAMEQGDPHAAQHLLPLVYDGLRKLAAHKLGSGRFLGSTGPSTKKAAGLARCECRADHERDRSLARPCVRTCAGDMLGSSWLQHQRQMMMQQLSPQQPQPIGN
jgi:hypothetical protein